MFPLYFFKTEHNILLFIKFRNKKKCYQRSVNALSLDNLYHNSNVLLIAYINYSNLKFSSYHCFLIFLILF